MKKMGVCVVKTAGFACLTTPANVMRMVGSHSNMQSTDRPSLYYLWEM